MLNRILRQISVRLTLYITLLVMLFALVFALTLYHRGKSSLELEAVGRLDQMTRANANELDVEITNAMRITDTLAALVKEDFNYGRTQEEPGYLEGLIAKYDPYVRVFAQEFSMAKTAYLYYDWRLDGKVHDIYYVDYDNDGTVSRQNQLGPEYFTTDLSERGEKAWWFGPIQTRKGYWTKPYKWVFDDGTYTTFVSYTRAVFDQNRLVAVVGTDFNYTNILELMGRIRVYDTGYPFLLNGDREFLVHPKVENQVLTQLTGEPYTTLQEELPFKDSGGFRFQEADGGQWLISYRKLRNGWTLGLAAPLNEVTRSAETLTLLTITLILGVVPLIGITSYLLAKQVSRPIRQLTEAVARIRQGDYVPELPAKLLDRQDELGILGKSLLEMSGALRASFDEITRKSAQLQMEIHDKLEARSSFNLVYEAFSAADNGLIIADEGLRVIHANPSFVRLLELESYPQDMSLDQLLKLGFPELMPAELKEGLYQQELVIRQGGDRNRYLNLILNRIEDRDGRNRYIGILQDHTEAVLQARNIEYLRHHDLLTGMLNKDSLMEEIHRYLVTGESAEEISALISVNLDDFRLINEAMGYECGDHIIRNVAVRLQNLLESEDLIARSSGDEFLVFIRHIGHLQRLELTGQSILQIAREPILWRERELFVTLSVGVAVYPFDTEDLEKLLGCSAAALNYAKTTGKNSLQYYSRDLMEQAFERYELSNQLREALERQEFFLAYQPVVRLETGCICGAEALLRWRHPMKGVLSPDRFIPLAEATGFIVRLGEWVLEEACRQLKDWERQGYEHLTMAVNLSAIQLNDGQLSKRCGEILRLHGIRAGQLDLEITETALMVRNTLAAENLARLKAMGVRIHIDDFGTGFSSLAYLRDFHIDALKIDRSFIHNIPEADTGEIARLIIDLSRSLAVEVVAEGIETEAQRRFLRENGCGYGQGYLFSPPVPAEVFQTLLKESPGPCSAEA